MEDRQSIRLQVILALIPACSRLSLSSTDFPLLSKAETIVDYIYSPEQKAKVGRKGKAN